jgi:hypothetical protein
LSCFQQQKINPGNNPVTPLPLDLTSFSGTVVNCAALLNWTTAEESGMSHFDLQKSQDGTYFEQLASIAVKGSNSQYAYADRAVAS